ncbi:TetR/AcrR family transcriptional regulator [Clostridium folliculivorans]|uniref:TetR family transcriptional regulator n=1 Tax=Clostridium folliculivorans TaxID=2886038 RepID=A0A9W5Y1Z3_9CLOT|nr:TetR/AcrR family transcriptional regulator [Clostridium folliculivorans]GKU25251.1 TetR family transcriptional regulator [Clostridium folliculivorans]GKU28272.1 TetR family transcriptional regulator [Clostridium folliculivorans]
MGINTNAKAKFIETSCRLFEMKGYHATGLNEILKESGAPKGSFYYHFPNGKEELALESIKFACDKITKNLKKSLDRFNNPIEGITANIIGLAEILENEKKLRDMSISLLALEIYDTSEILREACEQTFSSIEHIYFEKLTEYGVDKDRAKEIATLILALTEGAIILSLTRKNGEALRTAAKQIGALIKV